MGHSPITFLGRQHLGAAFNLVAYYILALPIGITLAFKTGLGLQGLWIGAHSVPLVKLLLILIQVKSSAFS
jgi:Na+-driven multidrug efflux pump